MTEPVPKLEKKKTFRPLLTTIVALGLALGINEGMRTTPYYDSVGVLTVCEGITGPDVILGKTYSLLECRELKNKYLAHMFELFGRYLKVPISQEEWLAYGHFGYNTGPKFFRDNFVPLINSGQNYQACARIAKYVYARGRDCRIRLNNCYGIVKRRAFERETCEAGLE
jgi:GH24 family phage-related lysozyme (muramidase)